MERSSSRRHLRLSSLHNLQIFLHCHFDQGHSFITMTVWIRSLFLLVLLAISTPAISYTVPNQHLCGPQLVEALYFVCGDRGFYYSPKSRRNIEQPLVNGPSQNEVEPLPYQVQDFQKVKRGIVQQCCEKICSLYELENYCN